MRTVQPCPSCAAPVTLDMARCPSCNHTIRRSLLHRGVATIAALVGGFTVSSTLAACYGAPCASDDDPDCREVVPSCAVVSSQPMVDDMDGDGYCKAYDCNERDRTVNAAARDMPNDSIDQDCDGRDD